MVLLEARGLSLFLVIRGGIAFISDAAPKHTRPNSLTDTHLEPSVSRTRPTTTRENRRRWKGLFVRDAQASCRCNCVASKSTPFFQIVRVMLAIFRARVRRAHRRSHPFLKKSNIEIVQAARVSASRDLGPFHEIAHLWIMLVIHASHGHALPV